jgi:signal transduction histidine kinase
MTSSQDAYKKIKEDELEPKSKYSFVLKNYLFWFLAILAIIIGAMAVAIIIFFLYNQDWSLYFKYASFIQILYFSLPYLWFFILLILISLAYFNFRKTEFGYRYSLKKLIFIYFGASIILGSLFYSFGFAQVLDRTFEQKLPFYTNLHQRCSWFWQNPQAGRLSGEIIEITNSNQFKLRDLKDKKWTIRDDKAIYRNRATRNQGINIRIMGEVINNDEFEAQEIKPFIHQNMPHNLFRNKGHMLNERNN